MKLPFDNFRNGDLFYCNFQLPLNLNNVEFFQQLIEITTSLSFINLNISVLIFLSDSVITSFLKTNYLFSDFTIFNFFSSNKSFFKTNDLIFLNDTSHKHLYSNNLYNYLFNENLYFLNDITDATFLNISDATNLTSIDNTSSSPKVRSANERFDEFVKNADINDPTLWNQFVEFMQEADDIDCFKNIDNISSVYHHSVPNVKLAYPEPFIASPSLIHDDIWFVHIVTFQYWLWFFFVFVIVFFFLTFLCTVRWCNMRNRPRRETRGVSRSKCGDLITATVPVTWAASIIINESTDAVDYYDGFGTTELVVGIRAYQWGWEYYYPKDIDLNYNVKPSYSSFIGNSLKYSKSSDTNLQANNLWKYYQNKSTDQVITPAHLLVTPTDNYKLFNFYNFNDLGSSTLQEINAFKKIRMFSKTYTSNLNFIPNNFSSRYKLFSNIYLNDLNFSDSYLYGLKRQHNFLSTSSLLNNQSTFLDLKSVNKIINFNYKSNILKNNQNNSLNKNNNYFKNYFKKTSNSNFSNDVSRINFVLNYFNDKSSLKLINLFNYSNIISSINDSTEKKKITYPIYKIFNKKLNKLNKLNLHDLKDLNKLNLLNDLPLIANNNETKDYFFNKNVNYKTFSPFSSNKSFALPERYIRNFVNNSPSVTHYNYSFDLNPVNEYIFKSNSNFGLNNLSVINFSKTNWITPSTSFKYLSSRISVEYPYSPVISNNPFMNFLDYDNLKYSQETSIPVTLQGKEEALSPTIANIYWNFYWSNSNFELKLYNDSFYNSLNKSFYLPMFNFYYDYDFRNWQALEMLEDCYWESVYSIYSHDEYLTLSKDFYDYEFFDKFSNIYNELNRDDFDENSFLFKPFFKDTSLTGDFYPNSLYLDDFVSPVNVVKSKDFFIFPIFNIFNDIDESYESFKFLNHYYNVNNKLFLNLNNSFFQPYSSFFIFDSFRSNYDGFSLFLDENNFNKINSFYKLFNNANLNYFDIKQFNLNDQLNLNKTLRFNNNLNLRNTVKSSIVTYNAIQKVFKTKFDEGKSNTKLSDFSNFFVKQPFISSPRIRYEKLLGKTKENFFKINFYKNSFQSHFNFFYDSNSSLNFYFFDFPFLLAMKSDSSRYLWFDWFAKWGMCEVQPSSSARYAIYGMPYFFKNFEFNSNSTTTLNEAETYLLRISRARKSYLPNWVYTPYFYSRNTSWFKNNIVFDVLEKNDVKLVSTFNLLNSMKWYWVDLFFINYNSYLFKPSSSGISSYARLNWKPQNSIQSYYYNVSTLIDILSKREYLYREFLFKSNKIISLPFYLTNSPSNPLLNEVKSSFLFIDPIIYNNEYSRDLYFNSLNFFNFTVLKSYLSTYNDFINLNFLTDYLFYYFFNTNSVNTLKQNSELYKNQYRPMRKGITNMIRLHATGAIAMPIEIRLQLLASSKDVIHSWAIPSAGIKIDCVPGYSSHKVTVFLVSGIFWGQCMEICGRYHHWMPIVVYFMKRDLFFLWCTHFVFLNNSNDMWSINDRIYVNYNKTVSFDKYSWLSELNN